MPSPGSRLPLAVLGVLAVGCSLGGVGVAALAVQSEAHGREIEQSWTRVQATVVDRRSATDPASRVDSHWATLEYTDTTGNAHRYDAAASSYAYDRETYELFYDPSQPERAAWPPTRSELWIPAGVLAIFGVAFLVLAVRFRRASSAGST